MPYKEKPTVKLYYSIGEVAAIFGVNTSLIRFWEKEFDLIKPTKNKKGNRLFTIEDIENFKKIFALVKGEGYTLQGAKEKLKDKNHEVTAPAPESAETREVLQKLRHIREELRSLKNAL